jgi:hypothetical protein
MATDERATVVIGPSTLLAEDAIGGAISLDYKSVPYIVPEDVAELIVQPQLPDHLLLGFLADGRFRVRAPIHVNVSTEGDQVILEAEGLDEFGFGSNLSQAIRDLQKALVELYNTLETEHDRLGPDLMRVWEKLGSTVVRRHS